MKIELNIHILYDVRISLFYACAPMFNKIETTKSPFHLDNLITHESTHLLDVFIERTHKSLTLPNKMKSNEMRVDEEEEKKNSLKKFGVLRPF